MRLICKILIAGISTGIFCIGLTAYIYITAPIDSLRGVVIYRPPNQNFTRQAGLALADNSTLAEMPPELVLATLMAEDNQFAYHHGIRPRKILRNVVEFIFNRHALWGGSTITQQLIKNVYVGSKRTLWRKYLEAIYAVKLERHYSKGEIFTLYASIAEAGPGIYGYRQAAHDYFHKDMSALTVTECAFITTVLSHPLSYTQWFREGGDNPQMISDMRFVLWNTILARAVLADHDAAYRTLDVSDAAKKDIFTHLAAFPWPDPPADEISQSQTVADNLMKEFLRQHEKTSP